MYARTPVRVILAATTTIAVFTGGLVGAVATEQPGPAATDQPPDSSAAVATPDESAIDMWTGLDLDADLFGAEVNPETGRSEIEQGVADDVQTTVDDAGSARVIVRLHDQADLTTLRADAERAGEAAAESLTARATAQAVADAAHTARVSTVVDHLQAVADRSQPDVAELLDLKASDVVPYWIFNGFAATVDTETLAELADHPDVASVTLDEEIILPEPIDDPGEPLLPGWGLERVNAPDAWGEYGVRGAGVVVGIMDSGVDGGHPALAASWRGNDGDVDKSWFNGTGENYPLPGDGHGHGTHVAGSIVGTAPGEITGVAPEAEWIAAKLFRDTGSTNESIIHSAFEWMLAPGGDPAAAPHVVNNSWGAPGSNIATFWDDVAAWVAAGIVPVFANGNDGPAPGTVGSPASFPHSIGVGATDVNDLIAGFSSRGPVVWDGEQYIKPQVSAPGHLIRSAWPEHLIAEGYRTISGTSMAAPHATGVVALMLSANPDLTVDEVREHLSGTTRVEPHMGDVPNNRYGTGIVDAFEAVTAVAFSGTVAGSVTGPDGPVEALVSAAGKEVHSDADDGAYTLVLPEGTHELTVSAYGFVTHAAEVTVTVGDSITLHVSLAVAPEHPVSGQVSGPEGPIEAARVSVDGAPVAAVHTDADGSFELEVAAGTHTLRAIGAGHAPATVDIEVDGPTVADITLAELTQPRQPGWTQYQNTPARAGLGTESIAAESLEESWTQSGANVIFASPVVDGGTVYHGSDTAGLIARDIETGEIEWTFTAGQSMRGTPAVADGVVYTGGGTSGGLYALDAETGDELWTVPTPDRLTVYAAPTVTDGVVYAATGPTQGRDDTVFAINAATGDVMWSADVGRSVFAGPAVADGLAVVGNAGSGELIALDAETGGVEWTFIRDDDYFIGGASLVDGTIYIPTTTDFGIGSLLAVDAASGELKWENAQHGDGQGTTPAVYGDLVIAGSHGVGAVVAYDTETGAPVWRHDVDGAVSASVVVSDDGYVIAGSQLDWRVFALDAASGERVWHAPALGNVTSSVAYTDGRVVTADARGNVYGFHTTGTVTGQVADDSGAGIPAMVIVAETGISVQADEDGRYELRDLPGAVTLTASLFGYGSESIEIEIVAGRTVTADFTLAAVGDGAISGTVSDEAGNPLDGAEVTVEGTPLGPVVTGADGGFTFDTVAAGTYELTATAAGYATTSVSAEVDAGETIVVNITLERFDIAAVADFEGRVSDALEAAGWKVDRVSFAEIDGNIDRYGAVVVAGQGTDRADADPDRFGRLVADADEAGVSLVFLDTGGPSYGSIRTLSQVTGDPASDGAVLASRGPVWLEDIVEHPITASLGDQPRVPLLQSNSWHAFFDDYSGYTLAVLGNDRDGRLGDGIGYQRRTMTSNHILLSAAAPSPWSHWEPVMADLLADAVAHAADADYGAVGGVVTDHNGEPVPASVAVAGGFESAQADAEGSYELLLEPGEVTLRFAHLGSQNVEQVVTVTAGEVLTVNVPLPASELGTIAGTVTDESRGTPISGATVTVAGVDASGTSGPDGHYVVADVAGGTYDVEFTADGYESVVVEGVVVVDGEVTTLDVELARAPSVVVMGDRLDQITTFLEENSIPATQAGWEIVDDLDGVGVIVLQNPDDPGREAFRAALDAFDEAGVSVIFPADGWATRTRGFDMLVRYTGSPSGYARLGGISGPPIYLHDVADHPIFAGTVTDPLQILTGASEAAHLPDYVGIPLATVALQDADPAGLGVAYDVRTPTSVHVLLTGLAATLRNNPASTWTPDGQQIFRNAIRWAADPGQAGLTGTVSTDTGEPIPNAVVEVADAHWRAVTDENGAFEIGVPPGEHTVTYQAFGYVGTERTFTVAPDQTADASVVLGVGSVGTITGVVTSSDGGVLEDVRVDLLGAPHETTTDQGGRYVFELVEEGAYELELEVDEHVRTLSAVEVTSGLTVQHDVELRVSPLIGVIDDSDFANSRDRAKEFLLDWGYEVEDIDFDSLDRVAAVDLVVANVSDFGLDVTASELQAFDEVVNRADIPVLWMAQHNRGAIQFLNEHHGDPAVLGQGFNDGAVVASVVEDHALVAGLPEEFELMTPNGRYTWFDEFGGTTVATLSTDDTGELGSTIAYRGRTTGTVDVLLSTMSATTWGAPSTRQSPSLNWTPAAERVYVNALDWALDASGIGAEVIGTVASTRDGAIPSSVEVRETGRTHLGRSGDGTFLVPLQAGTWTLEVGSFGHASTTVEVTVAAGQSVTEQIELAALPHGSVTGTLTGPDGGPVADADVTLLETPLGATSGTGGGYTVDLVPAGDWTLRVDADGFRSATVPVTVVAGAATQVDIQLKASASVAIVDTTGSSTQGTGVRDLVAGDGYDVEMVSRANLLDLADQIDDYDVVIFNATLLTAQREPFLIALDAAGEAGVSTILTSQFGSSTTIPVLSAERGDPAGVDWGFVSVGVDYVPTAEHPIFDGFPVGEPIELITSTLSNLNQQWGSYSGWSGVTVGHVHSRVEGDDLGEAVGYRFTSPASVDILLGSLSAGTHGWPGDRWTDNAKQIYLNAVGWAVDARQAEVTGVVTGDGALVAGATVTAVGAGATAVTGADGTYSLGLAGGTHTIEVSAFGFEEFSTSVEVPDEGSVVLDVDLVPLPRGSVTGTVTSVDGTPVGGASLTGTGVMSWSVETDASGAFSVDDLLEAAYDVSVTADGFVPASASVTVSADAPATLDVTLQPLDVGVLGDVGDVLTTYLRDAGVAAAPIDWTDPVDDYRVVIVNGGSPDEETFLGFLDAADDASVSLIFTGTWGVDSGGIRLLERYTDRVTVGAQGFGQGAVTMIDFDGSHALFAGLSDPSTLVVEGGYYSVLDSYAGTPLASLSVPSADGTVTGLAAGWDRRTDRSIEIVLSASAVTPVQGPGLGWTSDAGRLLVNAVAWAELASTISWDVRGGGPARVVRLNIGDLDGVADSVTLIVREAGTGEVVAEEPMHWTDDFYLANLRGLPAGEFTMVAEVVVDGVRYDLPGPPLHR